MLTGSLVAIVTPMAEDGSVDYAALDRLVDFHIENGTSGIVAVGSERPEGEKVHASGHKAPVGDGRQGRGGVPVGGVLLGGVPGVPKEGGSGWASAGAAAPSAATSASTVTASSAHRRGVTSKVVRRFGRIGPVVCGSLMSLLPFRG